MQRLEVSCAVRLIYMPLGAKGFIIKRSYYSGGGGEGGGVASRSKNTKFVTVHPT